MDVLPACSGDVFIENVYFSSLVLCVSKCLRAHGGCLGIESR